MCYIPTLIQYKEHKQAIGMTGYLCHAALHIAFVTQETSIHTCVKDVIIYILVHVIDRCQKLKNYEKYIFTHDREES